MVIQLNIYSYLTEPFS